MRGGKIAMLVTGAVIGLLALGLTVGGIGLLALHTTQRDGDGYFRTPTRPLATSTYALTSEELDLGARTQEDWVPVDALGTAEVRAERVDGGPVFVGIGPADEVAAWLEGSAHAVVHEIEYDPYRPSYVVQGGSGEAPSGLPTAQGFWVASAEGAGRQGVRWEVESGDWAVVVMNADATRGVAVDASIGVKTGILVPIGIGLLLVGLALGAGAVLLIVFGARESEAAAAGRPEGWAYPARLEASLDAPLSRWLWLVKWFLVLPHLFVLAFLWLALFFTTVAAGFAVLFTGRYPRALFDFAVGVLRWTWRATFYAFTLGTDRYPPFTLADDPSYPATFDVAYPATLSRGLVLVKWWLLAIPHYFVVALFAGGAQVAGAGLITVLVLVAAVVLLFRGAYPTAIFDFVMGMQRWCYRVAAYALLLRDEYPPFRLDSGGAEPGSVSDGGGPAEPPAPSPERELVTA